MRNAKYINTEATEAFTAPHRKKLDGYTYKDLAYTGQGIRALLSKSSHKFDMQNGKQIITKGMYLSPSDEMSRVLKIKPINTCPNATKTCRAGCLIFTGRMKFKTSISCRVKKTALFYKFPIEFLDQLIDEIFSEDRIAFREGNQLQIRLNGTSDIPWENFINMSLLIKDMRALNMFYDYTKSPTRNTDPNYKLTFSVSGKTTMDQMLTALQSGSIAIVVDPKSHKALTKLESPYVIDGDLSDHRPQDPIGSIVILKLKGKRSENTPFVKNTEFVVNTIIQLKKQAHTITEKIA